MMKRLKRRVFGWVLASGAKVQHWLPGVEMTEVKVHMATYSLFATDHRRQVAHRQHKFQSQQWLRRSVQVRAMHKRHLIVRNSAHGYSVKLSSCICSDTDSSCPGCWLM